MSKRESNKLLIREKLIKVAFNFFQKKGVDNTTVSEIIKKAYKWFVEIQKSGVICGCFFMSLYKKYPNILPGNKYKKINTKFNK